MKSKRIWQIALLCAVLFVGVVVVLSWPDGQEELPSFVPPPFDATAIVGMPTITDSSYMPIYQEGMSYVAHICGRVVVVGDAADVYFTNDAGNNVWMKLRVADGEGNVIGETGLIKPGEYIKSVRFDRAPGVGTKLRMKIMAYEPDTYYSAGAVTLNTVVSE